MPNKYNTQAKRLALDNMIRLRAWTAFQNNISELTASKHTQKKKASDDDTKSKGRGNSHNNNLFQAIVQYRNHHTTHRTLLHSLCDIPNESSPPPSDLIHLVASACPQSLIQSGHDHKTPLHLAIDQEASIQTISALMNAAGNDWTIIKQNLLLAVDSKGQTPLLSAVRTGIQEDIIKYLVNQDIDGSTLLIAGRKSGVPLKYVASNESVFVGEGLDSPHDLLRFMIVRTYHANLRKRFPSIYASDTTIQVEHDNANSMPANLDGETCLFQATIFCHDLIGSSKIASSILSYIIRNGLFDSDRLSNKKDDAGNLTLHITCLSGTPKFEQVLRLGDRISDYGLNGEDCTLMEYLVKEIPARDNSSYLCRNNSGDIPLHCAIKTGKDWSQLQLLIDACPTSLESFTSKGELPLHLAIKCNNPIDYIMSLWNHYPEAASHVDKPSGLYPFQLVAVFGKKQESTRKSKPKKKKKDSATVVDICWDETSLSFFLLRECPSIISGSSL